MSDTYIDILRSEVDGNLVGSNTVRIDNCVLKCKMPALIKNSPIRIILNRKLDLKLIQKFLRIVKNSELLFLQIILVKSLYPNSKISTLM